MKIGESVRVLCLRSFGAHAGRRNQRFQSVAGNRGTGENYKILGRTRCRPGRAFGEGISKSVDWVARSGVRRSEKAERSRADPDRAIRLRFQYFSTPRKEKPTMKVSRTPAFGRCYTTCPTTCAMNHPGGSTIKGLISALRTRF